MTWETPTFTVVPTGAELGYVNELDPPRPERRTRPERARRVRARGRRAVPSAG
jgi:hypothetical protein